ncbi:hypothetical protein AgCh_011730 [Apium graveolens]
MMDSVKIFTQQKDISLPEIHLFDGNIPAKLLVHPPQYLAFFTGGNHSLVRLILLNHWKNPDPALPVFQYLPKGLDYCSFMLTSKLCLCPSGHEVASPRIVEAIYAECVPVILSKNYLLPFSDVLRWEAFSLEVLEPSRIRYHILISKPFAFIPTAKIDAFSFV